MSSSGEPPDDGSPFDAGDVLVGMEAEADEIAEAADALASPGGADGVRRILDDSQPVRVGEAIQPLHVHGQSRKMHRHDGSRARANGGLDRIEVDIAGIQSDVHEHGLRATSHDHVGRRGKAQCGRDDLITRTDVAGGERDLQCLGR